MGKSCVTFSLFNMLNIRILVSWSTVTWHFRIMSTMWLASAFISYASYVSSNGPWRQMGAHSLVRTLIHTRIDYCRLVLQLPHPSSVSGIMRGQLHWLEIPDRVWFKLCTLVYRCLHGFAPSYLSDLCVPATVHAHLRSSVTFERSLSIPRTKTKTLGLRGFYFASSAAWNALPVHLRDPELSLNSFKT